MRGGGEVRENERRVKESKVERRDLRTRARGKMRTDDTCDILCCTTLLFIVCNVSIINHVVLHLSKSFLPPRTASRFEPVDDVVTMWGKRAIPVHGVKGQAELRK